MRRKIIKMFKGFDFTDFWTEDEVHDWDDYMESTPSQVCRIKKIGVYCTGIIRKRRMLWELIYVLTDILI